MRLQQRQFFTATTFDFGPDGLRYVFKTPRGAKQLAIDYADIGLTARRVVERHNAYFYAGCVLLGLGFFFGVYVHAAEQGLSGFSYALWGALFLVAYVVQREAFIIFAVGGDPLIVLADKRAPQIVALIESHRKQRFVELLASPELKADATKRQEFAAWLIEHGVFTAAEIAAAAANPGVASASQP